MNLTRFCIQRPIALMMVIGAILILGWRAQMGMPAELDPRVDIPVINVVTLYPGAGPEEVEQRVTRPIEEAVGAIGNIEEVDSRSLESVSFVTVRLKLGTNLDSAAADIRSKVEAARRELPDGAEAPLIEKFDYNARPVLVLGVTGAQSAEQLRRLVDEQIRTRIGQVAGVGSVQIVGGRRREVRVEVDPQRLEEHGLTLLDLLRPLKTASQSAPAGSLSQGDRDVSVRLLGEFESLEEIRSIPIPPPDPGMPADPRMLALAGPPAPSAPLRLRDVATVTEGAEERTQITRVGRRESIGIIVSRVPDANSVEVADGVKAALEELRPTLPERVRIGVLQDHSIAVGDALEDINVALILGALLAVVVVWLFLHSFKDTLIIALSIPTSIVGTFLVMYFAGFSLNQMTMLALSLSVGILIDDSILILESIHRHREMGKSPVDAALDGRAEIGLADAANTFVDVIVFLPIAFMGGIVGQFFMQFGLTIVTASLASLYISFTLTPMLAARWFRREEMLQDRRGAFARWFDAQYQKLEQLYGRSLGWALRHRLAVVTGGFGSLALVGFLGWQVIGFDFTPSVDRGQVTVLVELPPGASLAATDRLVQQVEAAAVRIPEVDADRMLTSVGEIIGGFGSIPDRGSQFAQVTLMLRDKAGLAERLLDPLGTGAYRHRSDEDVARELRQRLHEVVGAERIQVAAVRGMTSSLAPLQIGIYGNDLPALERVSEEIRRRLATVPTLQNVDSSLRRGKPELQVRIDRERADELFVSPAEVAGVVRTAISGNTDLRFREGDQSHPVRLMLARNGSSGLTADPDDLRGLLVAQRGPSPVYLDDVATVGRGEGPTKIMRSQQTRRVVITSHVLEGVSLGAARAQAAEALEGLDAAGVRWTWEGDVNEMDESSALMAGAIILAIVLSYMLMAALFNNMLHPFTIILSVPMALVGALLGLIYTDTTMNLVSMIGIVMLVGLVAKNAILLVDYTNTLRERGLSRDAAVQAAGPVRLRPILMTTVSTVIATLPVALQIGRGSEIRSPMAIVVIGGLLLSTLLTLLVIPVMYTYLDDFASRFSKGGGDGSDASLGMSSSELPADDRPVSVG
ncbi:MAG: efflux RND transporter permease subunit [Armatimonadota bacterium]